MAAVHARILLGCLLACAFALPVVAEDEVTPAEEAYAVVKETLVDQVDRGLLTVRAMERFLESLEMNADSLVEIRQKDVEASEVSVRHLLEDAEVTGPDYEREAVLKAVVDWVDVRESSEASPLRRSRELRRQ